MTYPIAFVVFEPERGKWRDLLTRFESNSSVRGAHAVYGPWGYADGTVVAFVEQEGIADIILNASELRRFNKYEAVEHFRRPPTGEYHGFLFMQPKGRTSQSVIKQLKKRPDVFAVYEVTDMSGGNILADAESDSHGQLTLRRDILERRVRGIETSGGMLPIEGFSKDN